jgi:hypothetical protein
MKYRTPLIALALLALAVAGCSKHSPDTAVAPQKVQDLGVVEVSDGVIIHRDLGGGRVCSIKPTVKKDGSVLLAMTIEVIKWPDPSQKLAQMNVITFPDRAVEFTDHGFAIGLTPHIKQ